MDGYDWCGESAHQSVGAYSIPNLPYFSFMSDIALCPFSPPHCVEKEYVSMAGQQLDKAGKISAMTLRFAETLQISVDCSPLELIIITNRGEVSYE